MLRGIYNAICSLTLVFILLTGAIGIDETVITPICDEIEITPNFHDDNEDAED